MMRGKKHFRFAAYTPEKRDETAPHGLLKHAATAGRQEPLPGGQSFSMIAIEKEVDDKAFIASLLRSRPLWRVLAIQDFFNLERGEVVARIEDGRLPYAFDISARPSRRREFRVLSWCCAEWQLGVFPQIGATKDLKLDEVIDLVLPKRDVRSTELCRRLACSHQHLYGVADNFRVMRTPKAKDGPHAFTVFDRRSVAQWLSKRRFVG